MKRIIKGMFVTTFLLALVVSAQTMSSHDFSMSQAASSGGIQVFGWHIGS